MFPVTWAQCNGGHRIGRAQNRAGSEPGLLEGGGGTPRPLPLLFQVGAVCGTHAEAGAGRTDLRDEAPTKLHWTPFPNPFLTHETSHGPFRDVECIGGRGSALQGRSAVFIHSSTGGEKVATATQWSVSIITEGEGTSANHAMEGMHIIVTNYFGGGGGGSEGPKMTK